MTKVKSVDVMANDVLTIDLSDNTKGIYFVKYTINNEQYVEKLIIK